MMTDREAFLSVCSQRAAAPGDVLVVLCGEDCRPRLEACYAMFKMGWAPQVLLTGGLDDGARRMGAERARSVLLGMGIAPERILVETRSLNTREQAVECLQLALLSNWTRLVLVASAYHMPRAFLTFLAALQSQGRTESLQLIPAYVSMAWHEPPSEMETPRLDLLDGELEKCVEYAVQGHVASYHDGIEYLKLWEAKRR